ncbi:hypothetical protein BD289DRAFT_428496 [Coniella lustricola]|uniref:Uncharacterized protein n=1 Tax=Coniella lustricola TaxID=2025994 RepID=A0A2T3AE22_9PEZI|nr:hypothetical protein BD289DRAFT_428496 [Coniella lustricola]
MKLTPIRVRGKRGQPKASQVFSSQSHDNLEAPQSDGRPKSKRTKTQQASHGNNMARRSNRALSRTSLLHLPQEMLESIFILSRNLSLPLVNRGLHHRLSADSIKYQLIGAAFGPTMGAWYGLDVAEVSSYAGWPNDADHIEGDPDFQSAVIRCSWATYDRLTASLNVWIRQNSHGRPYYTVPKLKYERLSIAPEPGSLYDNAYNSAASSQDAAQTMHMTMDDKLAFDLEYYREDCTHLHNVFRHYGFSSGDSRNRSAKCEMHGHIISAIFGTHIEVHPGVTIPDRLLAGPFESKLEDGNLDMGEQKMRLLFWLVRGGARFQADQTWESSREGFNAMLQLVTRIQEDETPPEVVDRRAALAIQLLRLFNTLNIFEVFWPQYILETTLSHVTNLVLQSDTQTVKGACLAIFAAILRRATRGPTQPAELAVARRAGSRTIFYRPWLQPVRRNVEMALANNFRIARAKRFLCARGEQYTPGAFLDRAVFPR